MDFGKALEVLRAHGRVRRRGWNGPGMWLALHVPADAEYRVGDHGMIKELPYIYLATPHRAVGGADYMRVPWHASQTDILAPDWEVLDADE